MKISKCLFSNLTKMSNFQPLEVVDRGSETQPQVVENLNKLIRQDKGYKSKLDLSGYMRHIS